jgi:hypothetical protein
MPAGGPQTSCSRPPDLSPREDELVLREIQEIRDPLEAFKSAVEAGEFTGFKDGGMRAHGGT